MKQRPRIYYSDSQKELMWKRWKEGWTLHQIAQLFNRFHSSVAIGNLTVLQSARDRGRDGASTWRQCHEVPR